MTALDAVIAQTEQVVDSPAIGAILGGLLILGAGLASLTFWWAYLAGQVKFPDRSFPLVSPLPDETAANGPASSSPLPEAAPVPEGAPIPPAAYLMAVGWIAVVLTLKIAGGNAPPRELTAGQLILGLLMELGLQVLVYIVLLAALVSGPAGAPWKTRKLGKDLLVGLLGFIAAVGPVLMVMLMMKDQRTSESEHQFLRILRDADSTSVIGLICLSAAVIAPLSEELTYRVTLMGGAEQFFGRFPALIVSSVIFAAVHGFPDMVALLPLALILGWIYQTTRSYAAIVTTHALFNAFNLGVVLLQTWLT